MFIASGACCFNSVDYDPHKLEKKDMFAVLSKCFAKS